MSNKSSNKGETIQSLERAIKVLSAFEMNHELSFQQLLEKVDLPKTTIHRLIKTFVSSGLIERDSEEQTYKLGLKLIELGAIAASTRKLTGSKVEGILRDLTQQCGETVSISILDGYETVIIEKIESRQSMRVTSQIGKRSPIHCSASGMVLVALKPLDQIEKIINEASLTKYTNDTLTDPELLLDRLREIKNQGYAIDAGELKKEQVCISAPIWDSKGRPYAAVTASGPRSRVEEKGLSTVAQLVVKAGEELSKTLGWRGY